MIKLDKLKCKTCGTQIEFNLQTSLEEGEVEVVGKCPNCGATIQVNVIITNKEKPESNEKSSIDVNEIDTEVIGTALDNLLK